MTFMILDVIPAAESLSIWYCAEFLNCSTAASSLSSYN